jgi:transposase InsO family protein
MHGRTRRAGKSAISVVAGWANKASVMFTRGNASLATPSHVLSHHGAATDGGDGKCRDECLNEHWFLSVADAKAVIEAWRVDYNGVRPHSSLNGATPDGAGQRGQRFGATAE